MQRLLFVPGFCCCAFLSPYLVKGSALLSGGLNALLGISASFFATPLGITCAALGALLLFIFKRRWLSTLV
jgi:hypothetical protein